MAISRLQTSENGPKLWRYWTHGPGLARWAESPTPWTTLRNQLLKYVPANEVDGLAATIFHAVFHQTPYQHAHPGRGKR